MNAVKRTQTHLGVNGCFPGRGAKFESQKIPIRSSYTARIPSKCLRFANTNFELQISLASPKTPFNLSLVKTLPKYFAVIHAVQLLCVLFGKVNFFLVSCKFD